MVLRKKQSYGEAEQSANPPPRQSPPQEPRRAVFGSKEHARGERDRWSSEGQSAAEGGGAKRWPEEGRRSLSPSGRQTKEPPSPPRDRQP